MRCRSSSSIAWKMPPQPPCSTIHSAVSAAFSTVGSSPRPFVTSPSRLPASDVSHSQSRELHVLRIAAAALLVDEPDRLSPDLRPRRRRPQPLQQSRPSAFERPRRQQRRLDARGRRGVGILIDGRVHAARARLVDQAQRVDALAPVRLADDLVMRDLRRQAALLADLDRLAHAVEHASTPRRACARCRCRPSGRRPSPARRPPPSA